MLLSLAGNVALWTLPFLAVLTVVVTIHELGHYLTARALGVSVDRFSIGFGRPLLRWRARSGTEWRIGWIPLGGYVRFSGDENAASVPDADDLAALRREVVAREGVGALKRYFHFKPVWQRALIVAAGPSANFVLSTLVFAGFALAAGQVTLTLPRIGVVVPGSPAAHAGLMPGDYVQRIDGRRIGNFGDIARFVMLRSGDDLHFQVQRGEEDVALVARPGVQVLKDPASGGDVRIGYLGVVASTAKADQKSFRFTPLSAAAFGVSQTVEFVELSVTYLKRVVTGRDRGDQLSGMIGIAGASKAMASQSIHESRSLRALAADLAVRLLSMAAMVSVAVGFANLLPIPVLDGGHLLFYGYEAVARRPLAARVQDFGYRVGFAVLIGLVLFSAWNDLHRYRVFDFFGGLFS